MMQYKFTAKEQEVLDAYSESLKDNAMKDARMSFARKLISVSEPDVIIMFTPEYWYEMLIQEGYIHKSACVSKGKGKAIYHLRSFISYLSSVFDAGKHLDDWFEPECRY